MKTRKTAADLTVRDIMLIRECIERQFPNAEKLELIAAAWEIGYKAALDDLEKEKAAQNGESGKEDED